MTLSHWLNMLGGVGLFLYGMSLLGSSIESLAGAGLEKTLEKLTSGRIRGVLLGAAVTGVIQSSSATSIMVVGFINAGIMKLSQGVSVMMGANIAPSPGRSSAWAICPAARRWRCSLLRRSRRCA